MAKTKSQLRTENSNNFPNNNSQFITPEKLRGFNNDIIDAVALENNTQLSGTGSFSNLSGSGYVSASEFIGDGSKLTGVTGSADTGSLLITASVADATITFTKGDASQFSIEVNNVSASIQAEDLVITVKNQSGVTLPAGTAVKATGVQGQNITIVSASADNPSLMPAIGVLNQEITNNASGECYIAGRLENINTSNLVAGAAVYVNNNGGLTSTKPTGSSLIQNIGIAAKINATEGELVIQGSGRSNDVPNIQEGYLWVGDSNGVAEAISTGSFVKELETGSFARTDRANTFTTGAQTINSDNGIILQTDGGSAPVTITPGADFVTKFTPGTIEGLAYIDMFAISSSTHYVGRSTDNVRIKNLQSGEIDLGFGAGDGEYAVRLYSGSDNAEFKNDVTVTNNITSSISKQNVIVNPKTITDDITIGENSNALVVGDVTFAGTVTIGSGSELSIFDEPELGGLIETASISGQTLTFTKQDTSTFDILIPAQTFDTGSFLTTASYDIDSASFDTRINNLPTTGSNTFNANQIVSGSLTATNGVEIGQISQYPAGTANLGVYGSIVLRSGSGIITDGAFGTSVPFDSTVAFFNGIDMQGTEINNTSYIQYNTQDPLPSHSPTKGRLAASGSAGSVNLYWSNGTTWTKLN